MSKTLFILNDPPYGTERSYNALRLVGSLAKLIGEEVRVFLIGDAASCAKSGCCRCHSLDYTHPVWSKYPSARFPRGRWTRIGRGVRFRPGRPTNSYARRVRAGPTKTNRANDGTPPCYDEKLKPPCGDSSAGVRQAVRDTRWQHQGATSFSAEIAARCSCPDDSAPRDSAACNYPERAANCQHRTGSAARGGPRRLELRDW